ncbi:anthranilate synthase component I [Jeotgalibacillus aurantiacus]|uniref:anthranilate synthase component I n=1 Tax=Jeotgalibacillus aurantiacus TaxID=2763266 RepID=UPI001D09A21F|nr:anthranilate synthase component I [Jeotgalibacillus aurantiacus]
MSRVEQKTIGLRKIDGDSLTPISIFQTIKGNKKCLLESSLKYEESGRYSFIAANPFMELKGSGSETEMKDYQSNEVKIEKVKPLEKLKEVINSYKELVPDTFLLPGGGIGYIGYDTISAYEEIGFTPEDELKMPDIHLMFYETIVMYDHKRHEVTLFTFDPAQKASPEELNLRLDELEKQLFDYSAITPQSDLTGVLQYESNIEKEKFKENVEKAKEYIRNGDIFQIVLSQRLTAPFTGSPLTFYRHLRKENPSPYMFYIDFEDYLILGASPESLIKVKGNDVTTNPIAGTRKRGKTPEEDQALAEELLNDIKEQAEHKMLVDLGRNDLGRVCEIGSITLPKYMVIEKYQFVMHIVSEVKGTLLKGISPLEALIATLPAGTVSGAPKIRAMQLINEMETVKRGVYAGAAGYISFDGNLDFALAIRTMVIKDQKAYVQAGAGIVYDSDPESEYQETINKAKSLLEVGA